MRRLLFLLLLVFLLSMAVSAACADVIKDFTFTPLDHAVEVSFSADGYDSVVVYYSNKLENGSLKLRAEDGRFTGTFSLPATYPGNNVAVTIKSAKVSAGAGFVVALTGDIMTMPGLPRVPAAEKIDVDENGVITGLF